jgi:hypothetical protein
VRSANKPLVPTRNGEAPLLRGRPCVVNEPFGDNSRYWIGPVEKDPLLDLRAIHDAFVGFRFGFTLDRDFRR